MSKDAHAEDASGSRGLKASCDTPKEKTYVRALLSRHSCCLSMPAFYSTCTSHTPLSALSQQHPTCVRMTCSSLHVCQNDLQHEVARRHDEALQVCYALHRLRVIEQGFECLLDQQLMLAQSRQMRHSLSPLLCFSLTHAHTPHSTPFTTVILKQTHSPLT